jgi:hypothetical protein
MVSASDPSSGTASLSGRKQLMRATVAGPLSWN